MDGIRGMGGALLALAVTVGALSGQATGEGRDCRCVDREGQEIQGCVCIAPRVWQDAAMALRAATGPRARIGIGIAAGEGSDSDAQGVRVESVLEDGPADEAGLQEGDLIVTLDGRSLLEPLPDPNDEEALDARRPLPAQRFLALMEGVEPGDEVAVGYLRRGERRSVTVEAEENRGTWASVPRGTAAPHVLRFRGPDEESLATLRRFTADPCFSGGAGGFFPGRSCIDGLELQELSPDLASYFSAEEGVLVLAVREGSALDVRPGDVILAVDGRPVEDPADVERILRSYRTDEEVTLRVLRRAATVEVTGRRR